MLSQAKVDTHSAFGEKSHTTAYTPKQGPSFPRPQRGFALPVKSILFRHAFIYIHFPVLCGPPSATAPSQTIFHPDFQLLAQMAHVRFHRRKWVHPALLKGSHTRAYTPNHGYFRWGWYHYPRTVPHVSETLRGQGVERQTLPFLGLGRGHSRRTQRAFGTAMRLCASLFRSVAAPLGCVIFFASAEIGICTSGAHGFPRVRGTGGITTLGALCVLLKCRTAACQKGSFAVF